VAQKRLELFWNAIVFEKIVVIECSFDLADLIFVFYFAPGQLPVQKLDQHVKKRPKIVVAPHFGVVVRVNRSVSEKRQSKNRQTGFSP
jgi:hypothetical protein